MSTIALLIAFIAYTALWMFFCILILAVRDNRTIKSLFRNEKAAEDDFLYSPPPGFKDARFKTFDPSKEFDLKRPENDFASLVPEEIHDDGEIS